MNFQQFKNEIEEKLIYKSTFELQEFSYLPYVFGHGIVVYRVSGHIFRFSYDGKDNLLTCERSNVHEKYPKCNWTTLFQISGLILNEEQIDIL
ncbi:hypothetical protein HK413_11745 [Mucilaginibacter sp. S1162]|uniref:Uncharacterized protein n=1 Tax=Mucilaginibacter humi TaxID=2732510 RepID=A0ABX1W384_9SPHI|nr:hypothetical protein [Mucilaginibacter humi]NNU34585.1 hypothetical protein [Mucilaginibacter humi]